MDRVGRFLGVRPGEWRLLASCSIYLWFLFASYVLINTVLTALFLESYDAALLPYLYVGVSVATIVMSTVYSALVGKLNRYVETASAGLGLAALLASATIFLAIGHPWFIFILNVIATGYSSVLIIQAYAIVNDCFDSRQAKRLLPLVGAGGSLGAAAGGLIASLLAGVLGTENLLYVGSALLLGLAWRGTQVLRGHVPKEASSSISVLVTRPNEKHSQWSEFTSGVASIARDRLLLFLAIGTLAASAISTLVKYQFQVEMKETFDQDEITRFLGVFQFVSNLGLVFLQLFLENRVIRRFGMFAALLVCPVAVVVGSGAYMAVHSLWVIAAARLADALCRYSLTTTGTELAFIPLSQITKRRAKLTIKGVLLPASVVLVSLLLVLLRTAPYEYVSAVVVVIGLIAIAGYLQMRRPYREHLQAALEERRLRVGVADTTSEMADPASREVLATMLAHEDETLVLLSLELIANGDVPFERDAVLRLFSHPSPEVSVAAIRAFGAQGTPEFAKDVLDLAHDTEVVEVRRAALQALARLHADIDCEQVSRFLEDPSLGVRMDAIVLIFAGAGIEGVIVGADALRPLLESDNPEELAHAASAVGEIGSRYFRRDLGRLLQHEALAVREAAVRALTRTPDGQMVPRLVSLLIDPPLARHVRRALREQSTENALPHLLEACSSPNPRMRDQAVRTLAWFPDSRTVEALLARAEDEEDALRYQACKALSRIRASLDDVSEFERRIMALIEQNIQQGSRRLLAIENLDEEMTTNPRLYLVREELRTRRELSIKSLFRLLEMLAPPQEIYRAYLNYTSNDPKLIATTLEVLTYMLSAEVHRSVVPYLESLPPTEKLTWARRILEIEDDVEPQWRDILVGEGAAFATIVDWASISDDRSSQEPLMLSTIEEIYFLKTVDLFSSLSADQLEPLTHITQAVTVPAGTTVFEEGSVGDAFYLILTGRVVVERGGKRLVRLVDRDCFGEMALLDSAPRSATVRTETDCELLAMRRVEFNDLIDEYPDIARAIMQKLSQRLRATMKGYDETSTTTRPPRKE